MTAAPKQPTNSGIISTLRWRRSVGRALRRAAARVAPGCVAVVFSADKDFVLPSTITPAAFPGLVACAVNHDGATSHVVSVWTDELRWSAQRARFRQLLGGGLEVSTMTVSEIVVPAGSLVPRSALGRLERLAAVWGTIAVLGAGYSRLLSKPEILTDPRDTVRVNALAGQRVDTRVDISNLSTLAPIQVTVRSASRNVAAFPPVIPLEKAGSGTISLQATTDSTSSFSFDLESRAGLLRPPKHSQLELVVQTWKPFDQSRIDTVATTDTTALLKVNLLSGRAFQNPECVLEILNPGSVTIKLAQPILQRIEKGAQPSATVAQLIWRTGPLHAFSNTKVTFLLVSSRRMSALEWETLRERASVICDP